MQPKYEPSLLPAPNEEAPRGPHCFRCLLNETDHTLYETVQAYIDSLSPELRAPAGAFTVNDFRRAHAAKTLSTACAVYAAVLSRPGRLKSAAAVRQPRRVGNTPIPPGKTFFARVLKAEKITSSGD